MSQKTISVDKQRQIQRWPPQFRRSTDFLQYPDLQGSWTKTFSIFDNVNIISKSKEDKSVKEIIQYLFSFFKMKIKYVT